MSLGPSPFAGGQSRQGVGQKGCAGPRGPVLKPGGVRAGGDVESGLPHDGARVQAFVHEMRCDAAFVLPLLDLPEPGIGAAVVR